MPPALGFILTSARSLDSLRAHVTALRPDVLKVVTAWGLPWDAPTRRAVVGLAPQVIVRTRYGDPSVARDPARPGGFGPFAFPFANQVLDELGPWLALRPDAWVEIGNEPLLDPLPGSPPLTDQYGWDYTAHLHEAITAVRELYPRAKIISPAHIENHPIALGAHADGQGWMTAIASRTLQRCDALGLHAYSIGQYLRGAGRLRHLVGGQPLWLTEFALNEPLNPVTRADRYASLLRGLPITGATIYHLDELGGSDPAHFNPQYRLDRLTLEALSRLWRASPAVPPVVSAAPLRPPVRSVPMTQEHLTRGRQHGPVSVLLLHATGGRHPHDLGWLRQGGSERTPVSCHYYIDKAGQIAQLVADHDTAWHAGHSRWRGLEIEHRNRNGTVTPSLNAVSIGIELENRNTGRDPYPEPQYLSAVALSRWLVHRYRIAREHLARHLDVSPGRKTDPAGFPWATFVTDVFRGEVQP